MSLRIILIGSSVRPLIDSCLVAGFVPVGFDLFADWDSRQMIESCHSGQGQLTKIRRYEELLNVDLSVMGDAAVLLGGAELNSDLVRHVSGQLPFLGAGAQSLANIADPVGWLSQLRGAGFGVPETQLQAPAELEGWLVKARSSCGGRAVGFAGHESVPKENVYYQKFVPGESWGALFVTVAAAKQTVLFGNARQLLVRDVRGRDVRSSSNARKDLSKNKAFSFSYRGSIGPVCLPAKVQDQIQAIGQALASEQSLCGVWGMDFVLDANQRVWPVDLNTRITASAELYERLVENSPAEFKSVMDLHASACRNEMTGSNGKLCESIDQIAAALPHVPVEGKLILFNQNPTSIKIDQPRFDRLLGFWAGMKSGEQWHSTIADIPHVQTVIESGTPICTLRERGLNVAAVAQALTKKAIEVFRSLE
jgi:predicted ATP-grasp superfamily ATP-dependent carboligase